MDKKYLRAGIIKKTNVENSLDHLIIYLWKEFNVMIERSIAEEILPHLSHILIKDGLKPSYGRYKAFLNESKNLLEIFKKSKLKNNSSNVC